MAIGHLGEAIDPVRIDAMRGRRVDDDGVGVGDELHGFLRCIVRQAEDDGVGVVHQFGARGGVLAALGRDGDDLQVAALLEPLADLEAGGAGFAVDEDFSGHG